MTDKPRDIFEASASVVAAFDKYNDVFCGVTPQETTRRLNALRESVDALRSLIPDEAPYVCPGCYAVGEEHCAPGCIDQEISEARQAEYEFGHGTECEDDLP